MGTLQPRYELSLVVDDLPIDEIVGRLIDHASSLQASDLFFASHENCTAVLLRHLGIFRQVTLLPVDLGRRCVSHIKVHADIDISEHRRPLDGRWLREHAELGKIDLRINVLPTLHGEDLNVRLLARSTQLLALENLGLDSKDLRLLVNMLQSPSGLILVTGPTGSGKTTTLYAALNYLTNGQRKINTIEDPIEYALEGIRQSQVNHHLGLDFPELLRAVLRQAPDVIMIGEIRDAVTAETAVRAANSGHLVLATLHAPVAAGAIQSMHSLGVNPHFLGASLRGVLAQRLVRILCPQCKERLEDAPFPDLLDDIQPLLEATEWPALYAARGCGNCFQSGFASRTGVFEVMPISEAIRKLIFHRQPTQLIACKAIQEGMVDIRRSAWLTVARGKTSYEELLRVIPGDILGPKNSAVPARGAKLASSVSSPSVLSPLPQGSEGCS